MKTLPASPDLSHLKKQAKQLLRDPNLSHLKLHDAQFLLAREYGFRSWTELKGFVEWKHNNRAEQLKVWIEWLYEGDRRERGLALRTLREEPDFAAGDVWVACATGDQAAIQRLAANHAWLNAAHGPMGMPPLIAVTHSMLILEPEFETALLNTARFLLQQGANPDVIWANPKHPEWPLSALYGAAGKTHHAGMLKLLLEAGANPDDNESLYHSLESSDSTCTRLLVNAGVRVTGTNAIGRALDYGKLDDIRLMLEHGGDANERPWIHHAILRGRSMEHIQLLAGAGADLRAVNKDGISVYRCAQLHGRADVVEFLRRHGIEEALTVQEQFVAACAQGDEPTAREIQQREPDIIERLTVKQLQALPEQADTGNRKAVRTMLELGWPLEVKAFWQATALNVAIYRGDAEMAEMLLKYGADWKTMHGFGNNVVGTLSWASLNEPEDPAAPRDFLACARVLMAHHVPLSTEQYRFSDELMEYLCSVPPH